jgi:Ca2+/Na+ antiporter
MFGMAVVGGLIVITLMSVSPQLAGIAFILAPIVIVILSGKKEKEANTAKYGWDPTRDKLENLPQSQQDLVKSKWDDGNIDKEIETQQIYRRQFDDMASQTSIHRGGIAFTQGKKFPIEGQMPSLRYYQNMASKLPTNLSGELMCAAKREAREFAKKSYPVLHIQKENHADARQTLANVVDRANRYLTTGSEARL